jgi:hypothetical protein
LSPTTLPSATYCASARASAGSLIGPDGNLYVVSLGLGDIYRISGAATPTPTNIVPTPTATKAQFPTPSVAACRVSPRGIGPQGLMTAAASRLDGDRLQPGSDYPLTVAIRPFPLPIEQAAVFTDY